MLLRVGAGNISVNSYFNSYLFDVGETSFDSYLLGVFSVQVAFRPLVLLPLGTWLSVVECANYVLSASPREESQEMRFRPAVLSSCWPWTLACEYDLHFLFVRGSPLFEPSDEY